MSMSSNYLHTYMQDSFAQISQAYEKVKVGKKLFVLTKKVGLFIVCLIIPLVTSCPRAPGYLVVPGFYFGEL